jgi:hypothetical protein
MTIVLGILSALMLVAIILITCKVQDYKEELKFLEDKQKLWRSVNRVRTELEWEREHPNKQKPVYNPISVAEKRTILEQALEELEDAFEIENIESLLTLLPEEDVESGIEQ